jgi:hypothetical protein
MVEGPRGRAVPVAMEARQVADTTVLSEGVEIREAVAGMGVLVVQRKVGQFTARKVSR